jgi:hypothetical protein
MRGLGDPQLTGHRKGKPLLQTSIGFRMPPHRFQVVRQRLELFSGRGCYLPPPHCLLDPRLDLLDLLQGLIPPTLQICSKQTEGGLRLGDRDAGGARMQRSGARSPARLVGVGEHARAVRKRRPRIQSSEVPHGSSVLPIRILSRHAANESPNLLAHPGSATARLRSPPPVQAKSRSMPSDHRPRLHDDEDVGPL